MATFNKDFVEKYGSLDAFAKADGCIRIYESDDGYHVVRNPGDDQAILSSPYVHNPRLVWERGKTNPAPALASRPAPAQGKQPLPATASAAVSRPPKSFIVITHLLSIFLLGFLIYLVIFLVNQSATPGQPTILQGLLFLLLETLVFGAWPLIYYALGGGLEWSDNGLPLIRKLLFWVLSLGVYGALFYGEWMLIRYVMAKIYKIPFEVARGRLLSNHPYVKKQPAGALSTPVPAAAAILKPASTARAVPPRPAAAISEIGILFDIDELGGGFYGYSAYKILFSHLDPQELTACSLWDGDTQETLAGRARLYCIAIQSLDPSKTEYARQVFAGCTDKGLLAPGNRFIEGNVTRRHPLVLAGQVDLAGNLVVKKGSMIGKGWVAGTAWNIVER